MAGEAYEILALLMRYVFVLIGALVLLRAYRWMRRDARNYRREMRTLPDAGLVGEIVDLRTGKSQPLPREGDMGASRECDIHVRGAGVLRHHVHFAFEEGKGVMITPSRLGKTFLGGAQLRAPGYALHGTQLQLGDALLRVRLFAGLKVPHPVAWQPEEAAQDGGAYPAPAAEEDQYIDYSGADTTPSPFEFPRQPEEEAWAQSMLPTGASPMPPSPPQPNGAGSQPDYEGHYTEDGEMTWKYAYSLEELYKAQEALNHPPVPEHDEVNDEALPYQSPAARHRRRGRR